MVHRQQCTDRRVPQVTMTVSLVYYVSRLAKREALLSSTLRESGGLHRL